MGVSEVKTLEGASMRATGLSAVRRLCWLFLLQALSSTEIAHLYSHARRRDSAGHQYWHLWLQSPKHVPYSTPFPLGILVLAL